ncbi:MAG TPA: hypothetical protein VFP34_20080 [Microlunatus sp.]|nr:hypothetical protein [Microlunatus sp.]
MCRPVTCKSCGKTTWAGCGQHVDAVMRNVSASDRCGCDRTATSSGGFFAGLFKR